MNLVQEIIGIIGLCLGVAFLVGGVLGFLAKLVFFPTPHVSPSIETRKLETDLSAARKECVDCLKTREELETKIKSLEGELAKKKAAALTDDTPIVIKAEPPTPTTNIQTVGSEASAATVGLSAAVAGLAATATTDVAASVENNNRSGESLGLVAEYDNLEEIYGVGPKLATLLHGLGIMRFKQIAQWTEADIDRVDAHLAEFQGRIRRENWVQSARECHFKKYGEWL